MIEREVFPTSLLEFKFNDETVDASRLELDKFKNEGRSSASHSYYTSYANPLCLDVGPATTQMLNMILMLLSKQYRKNYSIENSWVNYVPRGCVHAMHRHGDDKTKSIILYYDNIGETNFFDPRIQIYNDMPETIIAEKGKCVIFPGWLMHEMPPHFTDYERVTIAMNLTEIK
jgi:hypothetical protein